MSDSVRRPPPTPELEPALDEQGSKVRSRAAAEAPRPRQDSSTRLRSSRPGSSTRARVPGSLDDRIEQKLRAASELLSQLPAGDPRVRLLHVAVLRRDESLLDGVLRELNEPRHGS